MTAWEEAAESIVRLINSRPYSPRKDEIEGIILAAVAKATPKSEPTLTFVGTSNTLYYVPISSGGGSTP